MFMWLIFFPLIRFGDNSGSYQLIMFLLNIFTVGYFFAHELTPLGIQLQIDVDVDVVCWGLGLLLSLRHDVILFNSNQ